MITSYSCQEKGTVPYTWEKVLHHRARLQSDWSLQQGIVQWDRSRRDSAHSRLGQRRTQWGGSPVSVVKVTDQLVRGSKIWFRRSFIQYVSLQMYGKNTNVSCAVVMKQFVLSGHSYRPTGPGSMTLSLHSSPTWCGRGLPLGTILFSHHLLSLPPRLPSSTPSLLPSPTTSPST